MGEGGERGERGERGLYVYSWVFGFFGFVLFCFLDLFCNNKFY